MSRTPLQPPDEATFKDVISRFATGVTVITTAHEGARFGMTASAMTSVSVEPPMVLVCINRANPTETAVRESGRFGVSVLGLEQDALAMHFARPSTDKLADVAHHIGPLGTPLLDDVLATMECEVTEAVRGGTHTVFIGAVVYADAREGDPLTYFRGRFGRLESTLEQETYTTVREMVTHRVVPLGEPINVEAVAAQISGAGPDHVVTALVRLRGEHLVERDASGAFTPLALTPEMVDELFDTRCLIEGGVVQSVCGQLSEGQAEDLEGKAQAPALLKQRAVEGAPGGSARRDLDAFLRASEAFHSALVALGGSERLVEMYRGLRITGIWRRTVAEMPWWELFDTDHLTELAAALRVGDQQRAHQLVINNTTQVKGLLRQVVLQAGGEL